MNLFIVPNYVIYMQVRKCLDKECCHFEHERLPVWLPDPVVDDSGDHYMRYIDVLGRETVDLARPSLQGASLTATQVKPPNL